MQLTPYRRQNIVLRSIVLWHCIWRIFDVHVLLHLLLLSILRDKMWELLRPIQYIGFAILLVII